MRHLNAGTPCWVWTERQKTGYIILHGVVRAVSPHAKSNYNATGYATVWVVPDDGGEVIVRGSDFVFATAQECREKLLEKLTWCARNQQDKIKLKHKEIKHYQGELKYYQQQIKKFKEATWQAQSL